MHRISRVYIRSDVNFQGVSAHQWWTARMLDTLVQQFLAICWVGTEVHKLTTNISDLLSALRLKTEQFRLTGILRRPKPVQERLLAEPNRPDQQVVDRTLLKSLGPSRTITKTENPCQPTSRSSPFSSTSSQLQRVPPSWQISSPSPGPGTQQSTPSAEPTGRATSDSTNQSS